MDPPLAGGARLEALYVYKTRVEDEDWSQLAALRDLGLKVMSWMSAEDDGE
jgi:hypothetical protein